MCSSARAKEELSIKPVEAPNAAIAMYNCVVVSENERGDRNEKSPQHKAPAVAKSAGKSQNAVEYGATRTGYQSHQIRAAGIHLGQNRGGNDAIAYEKYKKRSHWRPALMKKYYTITQKNAPWVAGDNL